MPYIRSVEITAPGPSKLEVAFSFITNESSVEVCVETEEAAFLKLILRDVNNLRYVRKSKGCFDCSHNQHI